MSTMASHIASLTIVYSILYSGVDQRKHQNSASLAFVRGIHRRPVNSPHKGPVTRKMFPFDDVIMIAQYPAPHGQHEPIMWSLWQDLLSAAHCWLIYSVAFFSLSKYWLSGGPSPLILRLSAEKIITLNQNLKSPTSILFVQAINKENIKHPHYMPFLKVGWRVGVSTSEWARWRLAAILNGNKC